MDLQANLSPVSGHYNEEMTPEVILELAHSHFHYERELFIDGLIIHGHRLFGLPPTEPTYFCKWDFDVGDILVNGNLTFLHGFQKALESVAYSAEDAENALLLTIPTLYDVTFLSCNISTLKLHLNVENSILELVTSQISLALNDLANLRYSGRVTLQIPLLRLSILAKQEDKNIVLAAFKSSLLFTSFLQKQDFEICHNEQQHHIALHDVLFNRCPFLVDESVRQETRDMIRNRRHDKLQKNFDKAVLIPSIPLPVIPLAFTNGNLNFIDPNMKDVNMPTDDKENSSSASSRSRISSLSSSSRSSMMFEGSLTNDSINDEKNHYYQSKNFTIPDSSYLPPANWQGFDPIPEEFRHAVADYKLNPTSYYVDEDAIAPSRTPDSRYEYESFIVQFGAMEGYVGSNALESLIEITSASNKDSYDAALDRIQVDVLKRLKFITSGKGIIQSFRIIVPSVELRYGEAPKFVANPDLRSIDAINSDMRAQMNVYKGLSHIFLSCRKINIALRAGLGDISPDTSSSNLSLKTAFMDFTSLSIGLSRGADDFSEEEARHVQDYVPLLFQLEAPELWWHQGTQRVASLRVKSFTSSLSAKQLPWFIKFVEKHITAMNAAIGAPSKVQNDHNLDARNLVLLLSVASEKFQILDDASVLTKPAYIIRSSKHIRANDSWKVVIRLRHILHSLPAGWQHEAETAVQEISRQDARLKVLDVFSRWRSWEFTDIDHSYIFRHVFSETSFQDQVLGKNTRALFDLESIALSLQYPEDEDYLCFDYTRISCSWNEKTDEAANPFTLSSSPVNVDIALSCSSVRHRTSENVLDAYSAVIPLLNRTMDNLADAPVGNKVVEEVHNPSLQVNLNGVLCIENVISTWESRTVSLTLGCQNIYLSTLIQKVVETDMTITVVSHIQRSSVNLEENLNGGHDELSDPNLPKSRSIIKTAVVNIDFSFSTKGDFPVGLKYVTVSAEDSSLIVEQTVQELTGVVDRILETDYPHILSIIQNVTESSELSVNHTVDHAVSKNPSGTSPWLPNLRIRLSFDSAFMKLSLLENWSFSYVAKSSIYEISSSELGEFGGSAKIGKHHLRVLFECSADVAGIIDDPIGSSATILSIAISDIDAVTLLAIHPSHSIMNVLAKIGDIELNTSSIPSLLRSISCRVTSLQLKEAQKSVEYIEQKVTKLSPHLGPGSIEPLINNNKKPLLFDVDFSLVRGRLSVPNEISALVAEVSGVRAISILYDAAAQGELEVAPDDKSSTIKPALSGSVSLDELKFGLESSSLDPELSTIVRLQSSLEFSRSEGPDMAKAITLLSETVKVVLGPQSIIQLTEVMSSIEREVEELPLIRNIGPEPVDTAIEVLSEPIVETETKTPTTKSTSHENFIELANSLLLRMSFNDVCLAWLASPAKASGSELRGILFGFETLHFATKSLNAKTLITGVYLTPCNDGDDFFKYEMQTTSREKAPNTAYLPDVRLTTRYSGDDHRPHLKVNLSGETLKVLITPSLVDIVKIVSASLTESSDGLAGFKKRSKSMDSDKPATGEISPSLAPLGPPDLPFSLMVDVNFHGATIQLWDELHYREISELERSQPKQSGAVRQLHKPSFGSLPSLSLQSPAVAAVLEYKRAGDSEQSKHPLFNGEIVISPSSNVIHPKVMPVLMEMSQGVQQLMKPSAEMSSSGVELMAMGPQNPDGLLGNIEINLGVRFGKQEITLSCEPLARVAATVSYESLYIGFYSARVIKRVIEGSSRIYSGTVRLNQFRASLQHVYSRQVSGYIFINDFLVFASHKKNSSDLDAIMIAAKISDPSTDINVKQVQDLKLFRDIWLPSGSLAGATSSKPPSKPSLKVDNSSIMSKYHRAMTTYAVPWSIDFSIVNVIGTADMGKSFGKIRFEIDKFWLSSQKTSNWKQSMALGFDKIDLKSEGRLGGSVLLNNIQLRTAIMWERQEEADFHVPLVQLVAGLDSLESKVSFDYHTIGIISVEKFYASMFNQRDKQGELNDRLAFVGDCHNFSCFITSLAASQFIDIYHTLLRLKDEILASYEAILGASGKAQLLSEKPTRKDSVLVDAVSKLRTFLDMNINTFTLHIYPNTLLDPEVFSIDLKRIEARFVQEAESESGPRLISSQIDMKLGELVVALASLKNQPAEETLANIPIAHFVEQSREAKGGIIIRIPTCRIEMHTWQTLGSKSIDYVFDSEFGGKIDVGWNLGSVNFIKDMWKNHVRAFEARRETYAVRFTSKVLTTINLDDNLKDVDLDKSYTYVARTPPNIAVPLLRDMGEATPPIEWIGIQRQKLPSLTHQFVMIGMEQLVNEVGKYLMSFKAMLS